MAQDQDFGFGVRGDPAQPENASDDRVEDRVEHGGDVTRVLVGGASRVSVPDR